MQIVSIGHRNCSSEHMQYGGVEPFSSSICLFSQCNMVLYCSNLYPQLSFMYVSFEKENARAQPVSLSRALSLTVKQTTPVSGK